MSSKISFKIIKNTERTNKRRFKIENNSILKYRKCVIPIYTNYLMLKESNIEKKKTITFLHTETQKYRNLIL